MKLILRGVHYRAGARMQRFVEAQLREPLELFLPEPAAELDVILRDNNGPKGGLDKECSVTVYIPGASQPLHLTEASEDMYKSVHLMRDRVERAVRKFLERRRDHAHEGAPAQGIGNL